MTRGGYVVPRWTSDEPWRWRRSIRPELSDREIAEQVGVHHATVSRIRSICRIATDGGVARLSRNGTTYVMQTGNIGRRSPKLEPEKSELEPETEGEPEPEQEPESEPEPIVLLPWDVGKELKGAPRWLAAGVHLVKWHGGKHYLRPSGSSPVPDA